MNETHNAEKDALCHCGRPVAFGYDGNPDHHRGMCSDCDAVRCDAYPLDCPHRVIPPGVDQDADQ